MTRALLIALALALLTLTLFAGDAGDYSRQWKITLTPCAWCDATRNIEVHHIYPQHLWPERATDTNNMICLCRRCHFVLAHRCNFTNAVTNLVIMIREGKR